MKRLLPLLFAFVLGPAGVAQADTVAATHTCTVDKQEKPRPLVWSGTVKAGKTIEVDVSALGKEAEVFRAILRPGRDDAEAAKVRNQPVKVTLSGSDAALPLLPPRFQGFVVTDAVRKAVQSGAGKVAFNVESFPGYVPAKSRLEVSVSRKIENPALIITRRVEGLRAWHRDGQTFITWKDGRGVKELTFKEWKESRAIAVKAPYRYRIYRSAVPITDENITKAELVDEVDHLSSFNSEFYGISPKDSDRVPRYVVEEGKEPLDADREIYVHNPAKPGKAHYAVTIELGDGTEMFEFSASNSTRDPVEEKVGPGTPVLQRIEKPKDFNYVAGPTLHYYVRWESPPRANMPSRPFDYLVAVPAKTVEPAPVGLHLHCWGANLNGGYGWWYNAAQGSLLISTNQVPYDWWTGYHEHLGTWKSWSEGVVRDYTQTRLFAFLDWAGTQWKIDRSRVFTAGNSMGGSGSPNVGIRHPDRIAWVVSWVGVHSPARSPQFKASYEGVYGLVDWKLPFQDGKTPAFSYFDDAWYLRQDPAREAPLVCFANGKNDGGIGWPQARDYWKALQETRRPHVFVWGQGGHGQRALLPGPQPQERELGIAVRLDRTLPAFTNCSLDGNPGGGEPADGDAQGQSNLHLYWLGDSAVDQADRWELELRLNAQAPQKDCTVDVTPRRCQQFKPKPGGKLAWSNTSADDKKEVQSGTLTVDQWGLVTVPKVAVAKTGNRLVIRADK